MARKSNGIVINGKTMFELRKQMALTQEQFWKSFGITQSGGCRYEGGRAIPKSVRKLIYLLHYTDLALNQKQIEELGAV